MIRRPLYLSGKVRSDLPAMLTLLRPHAVPPDGQPWAVDNGRYARPELYAEERFLAYLERLRPYLASCLFAVAPDAWGDWRATLELALPVLPRIRELGYPAALVAQDGLESSGELNDDLWDEFDALFVGGSDEWRGTEAIPELVAEAKRRGKWAHLGRVNSWRRFSAAVAIGFDSADGTYLRFDPSEKMLGSRPIASWSDAASSTPSLWEPAPFCGECLEWGIEEGSDVPDHAHG